MTGPSATPPPSRFSVDRWALACLPRSVGNLVDRVTLAAVGALHAPQEAYVTAQQITAATGLTAELVEDSLAEAAERGLIARVSTGWVPVQEQSPDDEETRRRREYGLEIDCDGGCGAPAHTDCRTAAGRVAAGQHAIRRHHAARRFARRQHDQARAAA